MSSYGGTPPSTSDNREDATLQLAPAADDGPDFSALKFAFEKCATNLTPYFDQAQENFRTRYAIWDGQTSDGRKHQREGQKISPTPWDGASDLRVFLTDDAINSKVAMLLMAVDRANLVATPIEGNDIERAATVTSFLSWLWRTQIPELDRESELLAQFIQEKGAGALGVFWETRQETMLVTVTMDDIAGMFPQLDVAALIQSDDAADDLAAIFEERLGCSGKKAKQMIGELRQGGITTCPTAGPLQSRPILRAFNLDRDLFIPDSSTDMETAEAIYRVQYFSPEQLRSFIATDGWDEAWVEDAITRLRGQYITPANYIDNQPLNRSFIYIEQRMTDLIGVVFAYQRLSDEDNITGTYCTVFSPLLPPNETHSGYAKYGLLGYADGQYPFVLFKREHLSRRLHDTRGVPEPGLPWQQQIKVHKDSRIDAASLAILPPMGYPVGRPPGNWGAGARVPERRPGEYHFMDRPQLDPLTENSEKLLSDSFDRYFGFAGSETDPVFSQLKAKKEVKSWLQGWQKALRKVWKLWQQYGNDEVYFRVIGVRSSNPIIMKKGNPREDFDINLTFDVDSLDAERWADKTKNLIQIANGADPEGIIDRAKLTTLLVQMVDPAWAEMLIQPKDVAQQKFIEDEKKALSELFAGFDNDIKPGSPPQLGMQAVQNYSQIPDVANRLQVDDAFKKRLEKRFKQYQFAAQQFQNAEIGRMGAGPVQYNQPPTPQQAIQPQQQMPQQ